MTFELIAGAILGLIKGIVTSLSKSGVEASEIRKGVDQALIELQAMSVEEEAQKAKEWAIVTSASDQP